MAVKGNLYTKTAWAFEERPVASSKLNQWDDRIEAAAELLSRMDAEAWGGVDGILRGSQIGALKVSATSPESLTVEVEPGYAYISGFPYRLADSVQTVAVAAPSSDPRIDLVQTRLHTWDVSVVTGTEDASPSAPAADADALPLAELYLRPGMTVIKDADDASNGYITDVRAFL